jgi:3-oxoacyl-[acyl-carrier protein] reductase
MSQPLLDGRVALVTGSTRGIGRAIAEAFAAEGARVVVNGRRQADSDAIAATIPRSLSMGGDMGDRATIAALVDQVRAECGGIDILVNNAAIPQRSAITRLTDEEWDEVLRVNLTGPMALGRAVVPSMKERGGGSIINVISNAGTQGIPGFSAYAASKAGLLGLTLVWAKELARFGIRVNALSPGAMTDMMRQLPKEMLQPMEAWLSPPEDVAGAALFLASDLAKTVTGQVLEAGARGPVA